MAELTHVDGQGDARMVEVGDKAITRREARARGFITLGPDAREAIATRTAKKGDVLGVAQLAGIQGAKHTGLLIPLCHPLALTGVSVTLELTDTGVMCEARVRTEGRTGVEMEALTAVSTALLTVYDMVKAVDKGPVLGPIELVHKSGGRSGTWERS